jgi:hypothetical protein
MASSSQPFLNNEDPTFNVNTLAFARYNTSMSGEMLLEEHETL